MDRSNKDSQLGGGSSLFSVIVINTMTKSHMGRTELCQLTGHSLSSGKARVGTPDRSQVSHKAKIIGESGFWFALPGSLSYLSDTVQDE